MHYSRISTHFKEEKQIHGEEWQHGLDLKNMNLPANKHTILYGLLEDRSIFIKMEEKGMPPMKSGANIQDKFKAAMETLGHAKTWVKTRPAKWKLNIAKLIGMEVSDEEGVRKEHVPSKVQKEFKKTMELIYPAERQSFFSRMRYGRMSKDGIKLYKEGTKLGISKMKEIMESKLESFNNLNVDNANLPNLPIQISISPLVSIYPPEINNKIDGNKREKINEFITNTLNPKIKPEYAKQRGKVKGNEFCTTLERK